MMRKKLSLNAGLQHGFSLVELSIVLVILGLLTGGILAGQSLIRAAELRSVTTQFGNYHTAVMSFRDKYFALPGDMTNATAFWGSLGGTGSDATCQAITSTGTPTCNGNGDGQIITSTTVIYDERFRAWQHLANASLIEGRYTGYGGTIAGYTALFPDYTPIPGTNIPRAKISNGFFDINYTPAGNANSATASLANINRLSFYGNGSSAMPILKPEEAWNIDTKLDDGSPIYGRVYTTKRTATVGPNCATADAPPSTYDLTNSAILCVLHMSL